MARDRLKGNAAGYLYILPLFVVCAAYLIYPLAFTVRASFFDWNGIDRTMKLVGWQNYDRLLLHDPIFPMILRNFLVFSVVTVGLQCLLGLLLAQCVQLITWAKGFFKTVIFAPAVLTPVIIGNVFFRLFDPNVGLVAGFLRAIGLPRLIVPLLADPHYALMAACIVQIWQWSGYSMLLYIAGMSLIPSELYEAADVDGASRSRVFFRITVPMLRGTTFMLAMVGTINVLKQFDLVYTLTRGGPANSTQFFSIYIFRNSLELFKQGYASALATVMFVIALAITLVFVRRYDAGK